MIVERTRKRSLGAMGLSLALAVCYPMVSGAQTEKTGSPTSSVYSNPRAPSNDPRIGLKAGYQDAGEAAFGMEHLATLPKPPGFAPGDTAGPPPPPPPAPGTNAAEGRGGRAGGAAPNQYGSTNSDLAFSGNHLFVGNYNGINFYDIDNPKMIKLRTSLICPGGQGDVSVYGHLLFMSAEAVNGRIDCGTQGIPLPAGYVPPPPPPPPPAEAGAAPGGAPP